MIIGEEKDSFIFTLSGLGWPTEAIKTIIVNLGNLRSILNTILQRLG